MLYIIDFIILFSTVCLFIMFYLCENIP